MAASGGRPLHGDAEGAQNSKSNGHPDSTGITDSPALAFALQAYAEGKVPVALYGVGPDGQTCMCPKGRGCPSKGKHPIETGWTGKATTEETIRKDFDRKHRVNVGIRTGSVSGNLIVLDIDDGGREALAPLVNANGGMPETLVVQTGSGGQHFYFYAPAGVIVPNSQSKVAAHVDTRGEGGQAVGPGSRTDKGTYVVIHNAPIAPMPKWLLEAATAGKQEVEYIPAAVTKRPQTAEEASYERNLLNKQLGRLAALQNKTWAPGDAWDINCFEVACHLVELSNSEWTAITGQQAYEMFMAAAPSDDHWDEREAKWRQAISTCGSKAKEGPTGGSVMDAAPMAQPVAGTQQQPMGTQQRPTSAPAGVTELNAALMDTEHSGQSRMAARLAHRHRSRIMYVARIGWFAWDGTRWREDPDCVVVTRLALETLRAAMAEAVGMEKDAAKLLVADVRRCDRSDGALRGMVNIAAKLPGVSAGVDDLDADPYLLNCANGTLDLRTMVLRPHDPRDRITKVTRAAHTKQAAPDARWDTFLERVLPDEAVRGFLQRYTGLALCGTVLEHMLAILTRPGRNGKGVFYGAVTHALGDYGASAEPAIFMHREGAHPTGEMDLLGLRWVVVSESDKGARLAEATVKRLTGGDKIKARKMRQDFVEFTPSHTPVLVTNHLPQVSGDDPALWARLRVVPFDVVIPPEERDGHLPEKLQAEADVILAWALAGWVAYQKEGKLAEPEGVTSATASYQADADALGRFIDSECMVNPHMHVTASELWDRWARWAVEQGADQTNKKALGEALERRGFASKRGTGGQRRWLGLTLQGAN